MQSMCNSLRFSFILRLLIISISMIIHCVYHLFALRLSLPGEWAESSVSSPVTYSNRGSGSKYIIRKGLRCHL